MIEIFIIAVSILIICVVVVINLEERE